MDMTIDGIPKGFASKNFIMDPATDDMIYGSELEEGMIVLMGDSLIREDPAQFFQTPEEERSEYTENRLRQSARWCRVTKLRYHGHIVQFIGVYEDGTKVSRSYANSYAWYVKK